MLNSWFSEIQKKLDDVSGLRQFTKHSGCSDEDARQPKDSVGIGDKQLTQAELGIGHEHTHEAQYTGPQQESTSCGVEHDAVSAGAGTVACSCDARDGEPAPTERVNHNDSVGCDTLFLSGNVVPLVGPTTSCMATASENGDIHLSETPGTHCVSTCVSESGSQPQGCVEVSVSLVVPVVHNSSREIHGGEEPVGKDTCGTVAVGTTCIEEQLLRSQQLLIEEMEVSKCLREENERLVHSMVALQEELGTLRHAKCNAYDAEKFSALKQEGMQLSAELGKERERSKLLIEKKVQLSMRVTELEEELKQAQEREELLQKEAAASRAACQASDAQLQELLKSVDEKIAHVQELEARLSDAKLSHEDLVAKHKTELSQRLAELNQQRDKSTEALEAMMREKEGFVSSLQRNQIECERRIQRLEEKLAHANRRADIAETRLTDHERDALGPLRELRAALDDMERQKKRLLVEAAYHAEECRALERAHSMQDEEHRRQLAELRDELQLTRNKKDAVIQELQRQGDQHKQLQKLLDGALERASRAESKNEELKLALQEAKNKVGNYTKCSQNNVDLNVSMPTLPLKEHMRQPLTPLSSADTSTGVHWASVLPFTMMDQQADPSRVGHGRLERELVRQAVEIESLQHAKAEGEEAKRKLAALVVQHDLLMQMYGQQQEELHQLQQRLQQRESGQSESS
ncbi:hypothetical protein ERJ75_001001700 [Trypanosoma vivax]|uniref:Uncharacterized protein n=1 Tax=Trypanosoma vivax (strain Y486) TaxID=1055687 RepID=G0UAY1_TRYVY|nr:hypothetical protein TRVL_02186 [Trypanosoma vivax]KAH8611374.1 hypothetical protein ERJ75_001001700 [Trypanosoma vivax]CCC52968.1 conserved hypothetical protein [Trypanosoma vivax Y486]